VYFYIARELLPALVLFTVAFLLLLVVTLGLAVTWTAGKQVIQVSSSKSSALDARLHLKRRMHIARAGVPAQFEVKTGPGFPQPL
jgi:hypothetical protein